MEIELEPVRDEWPLTWHVTLLADDVNRGEYDVTLTEDEYHQYGSSTSPAELIEATFRFLLDREEPEMILEQFSLSTVEQYFPEYPDEIATLA